LLSWQSAVAENQPTNKHRVNTELSNFAARLGALISRPADAISSGQFSGLALELFALQYAKNPAYRRICDARRISPLSIEKWSQIPCVPTEAFKEMELTSLNPGERTTLFYSSGTTGQKSSRHFHNHESLRLYEQSLWAWFEGHFDCRNDFLFLTPVAGAAPNSSLVHMFEIIREKCGRPVSNFTGRLDDGGWTVDFSASVKVLEQAVAERTPITVLGTAFSFVHLLDYLAENRRQFELPAGSRVMETGGYKNRSRVLPKPELHALIAKYLGVGRDAIVCEYGMSELSSQAYDCASRVEPFLTVTGLEKGHEDGRRETNRRAGRPGSTAGETPATTTEEDYQRRALSHIARPTDDRYFQCPPWARVQIISPETGMEVAVGETGLIRIFDLANVFSVAAIQTEDLGVRREAGFELVGRAQLAEPRGCSLMTL
jgi:hypothetical protein